jgi:hypothetical protein
MKILEEGKMRQFAIVVVAGLFMCSICTADMLNVLAPGYSADTYAVVSCPGTEYVPNDIAWDSQGNMYLSLISEYDEGAESYGSVYRVAPDRTVTKWLADVPIPRKMVWGGGSPYQDYLYVASGLWAGSAILKVAPDGQYSTFAQIYRAPHALAIDTTGNYGGYMYTATRAGDLTYRIKPDGTFSVFSQFPKPAESGGGPIDIAFDTFGKYGGSMYMSTDFLGAPASSGLFRLDALGQATRFAPSILGGYDIAIDPLGLFSGAMFASGRTGLSRDVAYSMWQVLTDGTISEFARTTGVRDGIRSFSFGPDGAMYVPLFFPDDGLVVVSRISAVPLPGAALLGAIGLSYSGWRLRRKTT